MNRAVAHANQMSDEHRALLNVLADGQVHGYTELTQSGHTDIYRRMKWLTVGGYAHQVDGGWIITPAGERTLEVQRL